MKILITTDWYKPVINGVVTSVTNLEEGLRGAGHDVRILTLSNDLHSYRKENVTFIGSIGVGVIYPNARLRARLNDPLVQELIDWKPDVVHSQCEFSTFSFAKRIAHESGCPLIHTYHTVYEDFTHYFSPNVRLGHFLARKFSHYIASQTDAVIVPTEKIRNMLRSYQITQPIRTVPTGLKMGAFLAPLPPEKRTVLRRARGLREGDLALTYIGRLAQEKSIGELLRFLPDTPQNVRLLLVGDGPYREKLEAQVRELGIAGRVIFSGMAAPERVADYYKVGDIFVSASRSETQGLTYIEAMASGLPLLCRKDDCLSGVLLPEVNGFAYTTEAEFLAGLSALSDAQTRRDMGAAAQSAAYARFSAESFTRKVLQVYQDCLPRSKEASAA